MNARGARVGEVAVRHAAEITATDVSGPAHVSAAEMGATEMLSAAAEVMTATATTATTATMTFRQAGAGSENEHGERNCRDQRFENLACHSGTFVCKATARTPTRNAMITPARTMLFPFGRGA